MEFPDTNMWMVRAEWGGTVLDDFLAKNIAYLGWGDTGPVYPDVTREVLKCRVERENPSMNPRAVGNATRCIWEFCCEVEIGDLVVTYDPSTRLYHVGVVKSDAEEGTGFWIDPAILIEYEVPRYVREVDWGPTVSRDHLSLAAQRHLGRPPTHFQLPAEVSAEIRRLCR